MQVYEFGIPEPSTAEIYLIEKEETIRLGEDYDNSVSLKQRNRQYTPHTLQEIINVQVQSTFV